MGSKHFRPYLLDRKLKIYTGHQTLTWLTWLFNIKDVYPGSWMMQWRLKLAKYLYEVVYKAGTNVDALSHISDVMVLSTSLQGQSTNSVTSLISFEKFKITPPTILNSGVHEMGLDIFESPDAFHRPHL